MRFAVSLLCAVLCIGCAKTDDTPDVPDNTTEQWLGTHAGSALFWTEQPGAGYQIVRTEAHRSVTLALTPGAVTGTIDVQLTDDGESRTHEALLFDEAGDYGTSWGGGSQLGSLVMHLHADSLAYQYRQKCGIPCTRGVELTLRK